MTFSGRAVFLGLLLLMPFVGIGQSETMPRQGFIEALWTEDDGLPENSVLQIIFSHDGYLWGATYEGLIRFDGHKMEVFDKSNIPTLKTNQAYSICEDAQRQIWIATNGGGITRFNPKTRAAHTFTKKDNGLLSDVVRWIVAHPDGSIWAGTEKGLNRYMAGQWQAIATDSVPSASSVMADSKGQVWVASPNGRTYLVDGNEGPTFGACHAVANVLGQAVMFAEDRHKRVWIAAQQGLCITDNGVVVSRMPPLDGSKAEFYHSLYYDEARDEMWAGRIGSELFLFDRHFNMKMHFKKDPNLDTSVNSIVKDREGNIWFGMYKGGLRRLQKARFRTISTEDGLADNTAKVICSDKDGNVYIGTNNGGISRYDAQGNFTHITTKQGLSKDNINALWHDSRGNLWAGTYHGYLNRIAPDGKITHFNDKKGLTGDFVSAVFEDSRGRVWVGTYGDGLFYIEGEQAVRFRDTSNPALLQQSVIRAFHEDGRGTLWVGANDGLYRIDQGTAMQYTTDHGLGYNMVISILEDADGGLWIGTRGGGLSYFKDGKFYSCTMSDGLFNDVIHAILDDGKGTLWMSCNKGIFTLKKEAFHAFALGRQPKVVCEVYGKTDGMLSAQCNGGFFPAAWRTGSGQFWFPTVKGAVMVDPAHLPKNEQAPIVKIELLTADGHHFSLLEENATIRLGTTVDKVQIDYTAISYTAGEKVRFKFRLEGYDKGWIDAGNERMVYYTNLPYGTYTFKVIASNNDGVWNEAGASMSFEIAAPIWQKPWFYAFSISLLLLLVVLYIRGRETALRRTKEKLEALVLEKTIQIRAEKEKVEQQNLALVENNAQIAEQKAIIEKSNQQTTDSIKYARRIQDAMFPSVEQLQDAFAEAFLLYLPRNIVSGDFFWLHTTPKAKRLLVGDCTGHGVPGAFMTVMGINFLNEISQHEAYTKAPHEILAELDEKIVGALSRNEKSVQDGMDLSLAHFEDHAMLFSGAKNPGYYVREGQIHILEASRSAIGGSAVGLQEKKFESQTVLMKPGDIFYFCSDGYQDQFGGTNNRKFMVKRMRELLLSISHLPMPEQKKRLEDEFRKWKGHEPQTDDVLIIGVRPIVGG